MTDPGEIIRFNTENGQTRADARLVNETVCLSVGQMVELFQHEKSTIAPYIPNIIEEGELKRESVDDAVNRARQLEQKKKMEKKPEGQK